MTALADLPELLTVDEVAALYRVSRTSAYDAVRAGDIPSVKIGRRVRVPKAALLRALGVEQAAGPSEDPANGVEAGWKGVHRCTSTAPVGVADPVVTSELPA